MRELKALTEKHLGAEISQELFDAKLTQALHKLRRIIGREGDAGGEREKPYYIAQLVAEAIVAEMMTTCCMQSSEDKKRAVRKANSPNQRPHYSISETVCQVQSN